MFASTYFDIINAFIRRGGNWFLVCLSFAIQSEMLSEVTVILVVADIESELEIECLNIGLVKLDL